MRLLLRVLLGNVLTLLLVGTTPVGTGQGVHANQLLDAVVPHVHLVNGQIIQPGQIPPIDGTTPQSPGPALGAGSGAAGAAASLVVTPPVPHQDMFLHKPFERYAVTVLDDTLPLEFAESPPDPPPTS